MNSRIIIARIAYNGTGFHGYQRQPGLRTVESIVFDALTHAGCTERLPPEYYSYSGRTDKGVHALYQTISFLANSKCSLTEFSEVLRKSSNGEILLWAYRTEYNLDFNARRWALWREYVYVDELSNYICKDFREHEVEARRILVERRMDYAYRGVKRFTQAYLERRIIRIALVKKGSMIIWGIMGESFPHNYIRRLVYLLRTRPCATPFLEHARRHHQGMAEPGRLILSSVKYPISLQPIYSKTSLKTQLEQLFKKESSVLRGLIWFYENVKTFSHPFQKQE